MKIGVKLAIGLEIEMQRGGFQFLDSVLSLLYLAAFGSWEAWLD